MNRVPESEWRWCGYPGHFIGSFDCLFHMKTRVGPWIVSTVGDYRPNHGRAEEPTPLGVGAESLYETFVFAARDDVECHAGMPSDWTEVEGEQWATPQEAEAGHLAMCLRYAEVAA